MPSGHSIRRKTIDHRWPRQKTYKIIPNISRVTTKKCKQGNFFHCRLAAPLPSLSRRPAPHAVLLVQFVLVVLPHCLMRPIQARPADVPGVQGELRPAGAWGSAPHPSFFPSILLRVPSWSFVSLRVFIPIPTFFLHPSLWVSFNKRGKQKNRCCSRIVENVDNSIDPFQRQTLIHDFPVSAVSRRCGQKRAPHPTDPRTAPAAVENPRLSHNPQNAFNSLINKPASVRPLLGNRLTKTRLRQALLSKPLSKHR